MSAEELLRRYLEQRRELGEQELVLDGMSVEDVMRIIGVRPAGMAPGVSPEHRASDRLPRPAQSEHPAAADVARERPVTAADLDWRSTLASSGNKPLSSGEPTPRDPAPSERGGHEHPDTEPAAPASNAAPSTRGVAAPSGLVVNADEGELFGGPISRASSLEEIAAMIETCTRCPLYKTATHAVPGEGNPHAQLMCVGEAPGATEDETGRPFVGAAGQLLTKILAAINLKREDVYITNVLKHRPPGNRNPMPDEVTACRPYLVRQIELIRPKVILAFGTFAAQSLLDTKLALGKLRGAVHRYHGIPVVVTYHPAALLRNPAWKRPTWEDVQLARRILDNASA